MNYYVLPLIYCLCNRVLRAHLKPFARLPRLHNQQFPLNMRYPRFEAYYRYNYQLRLLFLKRELYLRAYLLLDHRRKTELQRLPRL